ncbi:hypothetical protein YC2023_014337 [Brassica napus]
MLEVVWTTEVFFRSGFDMQVVQIWKTSWTTYLLEVVWTSRKSSGLHGSLLTKSPFHNRSEHFDLEDFWDDLPVSRLEVVWKSSGLLGSLQTKSSGLPVKSSGLPSSGLLKSRVVLSTQVESKLVFVEE